MIREVTRRVAKNTFYPQRTRRTPEAYRIFFAQLRRPATISRNLHPKVIVQTNVNEA